MSSITAVPLRAIPRAALIALWIGIAALVVGAFLLATQGTKAQVAMAEAPEAFLAQNAERSGVVTLPSGLQYKVIRPGTGPNATAHDLVVVNYDGQLASGVSFDASAKHGGPATLPVGGLIPGWVEGLQHMNRGSKYRFWIPPTLGYGPQGAGNGVIPPNALLVFDVEMLEIISRPPGAGMSIPGMGQSEGQPPEGMPAEAAPPQ
jgi:FKBP-type peptidyl-prolyl cis-trans isomerase FkpA